MTTIIKNVVVGDRTFISGGQPAKERPSSLNQSKEEILCKANRL